MTKIEEIEQLCFFGMRLALRRRITPENLHACAAACAKRRNRNLSHWICNDELPPAGLEGLEKVQSALELGRGVVITSFQIGPYNWIPLILNRHARLPVTLLMDAANFQEEQRRWTSREGKYRDSLLEPVRYINSEETTALWKMACSLRAGRTLVGWMDGHTGVTAAESARSTLSVRFCDTRMHVRTGLPFLSAKTGAPLILAVARNEGEDQLGLRFEDPLVKGADETVEQFRQRAAQQLVSILEREVLADPACWEEWCHFHSWNIFEPQPRAGDPDPLDARLMLDDENVDVLDMPECEVLVSLNSGEALAMTPLMAAIRDTMRRETTARDVIGELAARFEYEHVRHALEVLRNARFLVETA